MKRLIPILMIAALAMGGCAQLQAFDNDVKTAFQVATSAAVTPQQAYIAINVYDGVAATATNYLGWPKCNGTNGPACRDPVVRAQIKKVVLAGRLARNDVKAFLRANPGENLNIKSFADLQSATASLKSIIAAYQIN